MEKINLPSKIRSHFQQIVDTEYAQIRNFTTKKIQNFERCKPREMYQCNFVLFDNSSYLSFNHEIKNNQAPQNFIKYNYDAPKKLPEFFFVFPK